MNFLIKLVTLLYLTMNVKLLKCVLCFDVKFRAVYDAEIEPFNTQTYKREMAQFFDKASYSFNGFKKVESIPVLFPIDICVLTLDGVKYAASLHKKADGSRHFAVHKMHNATYQLLAELPLPLAIAMDCKSLGSKGFIAVAYNFSTPVENAREGSPIYELSGDRLRAIQYFAAANLVNLYLRAQANDLMLLQTFKNTKSTPNLHCPYFKWSGSTFNRVGQIPCSNARHLEPFSIDYEDYVAVANFADQRGRTSTNSEIYKYLREKKQFVLFQKIKTNGAVDVRYFSVPVDEARRQHFLIFGNSISSTNSLDNGVVKGKNLEADSVVYVFDKGQFVPYQRLTFYAVKQFLPIQNVDAEKFLLLVASSNQDIKIYNLNDWKFEESTTQFTEGALGRGVAHMRVFQELDTSYLIIANENMAANETNIFSPIFKQEEHANSLRQQIIDWAKENMQRLRSIDVEKLKTDMEKKLQNPYLNSKQRVIHMPNAHIENVVTESLTSHRLHMDSNYWKALSYAQRALNALEKQQKPHKLHKREAAHTLAGDFDFETIKVGTLSVRNKLAAKNLNGIQSESPKFTQVKAKEVVVTGKYIAPIAKSTNSSSTTNDDAALTLHVENLNITGKLNGLSCQSIFNDTLKLKGFQFVKSSATFQNLTANAIFVTNEEANNMSLAKLVSINSGNYAVGQRVQFDAPITAKNVVINERLNQIHVLQQKMDVLLKNSNTTQVITGPKRLNNVRLLQPIMMSGSMPSNHLRAISPSKAVHQDLVLHGDYVINGEVIVMKMLASTDLIDHIANTSLKATLNNGLRVDLPLQNVNLKFKTPTKANNSIVSFINTKDLQQLIKSNTAERQFVEGFKFFKNDLVFKNGLHDAKLINGVDTENLFLELLTTNTNQTIKGSMHFGRILAKGLEAPRLTMQNKLIKEFLSKSGNQHVNGTLKVDTLKVENFVAQNLNTNGKIFEKSIADIYQPKHANSKKTNIFQHVDNINGTIYVKNLVTNASLNGKPVAVLEQQLQQLEGNIKYVGNFNLNYEMSIANLTFTEQFNGIPATEFGKCWLQKSGAQTFTAPQTFASANFKSGAALKGRLNGFHLKDFYEQTFWIDRDEYIKDAKFLNPIQLQQALNTGTLNDFEVPKDFLYHSSKAPHILNSEILIEKDLLVKGNVSMISLNDVNINLLKNYLYSNPSLSTLFVKSANFCYAPSYQTLNNYRMAQMLDTLWLANENVELMHHVEINEANFEGLLDLEGPINNMNLQYLQENYLSSSKPQTILTDAMFMKKTNFQTLRTDEIHLLGPLAAIESNKTINFDEFVSNTLKTSGYHEIRSNWKLIEAAVAENLRDVTINELNLAHDVLRLDVNNFIKAEKRVAAAAYIRKLYTKPQSTVNGVNIGDWLKYAAYQNCNSKPNQTIYGKTTIGNANIGDVNVAGDVEHMKFVKENLWLRDENQQIPSRVSIRNKLLTEQRILVNNIKNLDALSINNKNLNDFLDKTGRNAQAHMIESHLIFEHPLAIAENENDESKTDKHFKRKRQTTNSPSDWNGFDNALKTLQKSVRERQFVVKGIKIKQIFPAHATKLIHLPILMEEEVFNLIGFLNESSSEATNLARFYYWSNSCDCFLRNDKELSWLPKDPDTLEILKLLFGTDYITVNKCKNDHNFGNIISSDGFKELLHLRNKKNLSPFKLNSKDCLMVFGEKRGAKIQIYCLDAIETNPLLKFSLDSELDKDIRQITMISNDLVALLVDRSVEIWSTNKGLKFHERLPLTNVAKQLKTCQRNGVTFLAIVVGTSKDQLPETVEIYSFRNESDLQHQQTISIDAIIEQIDFHMLSESQDLLLLMRTKMIGKSLFIYQFQGVKGFQKIFVRQTQNVPTNMQIMQLKNINKHFIVLFTENSTDMLEIVTKKL